VALVNTWIPLPPAPILVDAAEPYLIPESRLDDFRSYISSAPATSVDVDFGSTNDVAEVIDALKAVLPFPDWCGSNWDSIEDAFEDIREEWSFPLVIVAHGLDSLIRRKPHLALEVVLRMSGLSQAFSAVGEQLMVTYVGKHWA
jgi:hypothetical protein